MYSCASAHGRASSWLRLSPCPLPDEMHPRRRRGRTSERIAMRHRRRGVIDPCSPALHADPATPAPGKSWLLRHGPVQREGPAQGQAADLVARGMAAAATRRRSVGTWSRDGIAPARVVAGRAPETPPKLKPALELLLGPGFGAGSGWRSCGARRGGSGCDPSARGPETAMRELAALLDALRRRYSGPSPHLWPERPATGCCGTGERRSGLGLRRQELHAWLGGTALTLRLALLCSALALLCGAIALLCGPMVTVTESGPKHSRYDRNCVAGQMVKPSQRILDMLVC